MSELQQILSRQVSRWEKERRGIEQLIQSKQVEAGAKPAEVRPVVTISRQRGCRGRELAKLLAHDLRYGMLDQSIINYIAEHMGVRSEVVELLDEHEKSELELWLQSIFTGKIFDHDNYIKGLGEAIKGAAMHGGVVIVGRGANLILNGSLSYRVRLTAPLESRVKNLVQMEGMNEGQAKKEIAKVDRERAQFIKRYFKRDIDCPDDYDLVLNCGTHNLDSAVKIILSAIRSHGWPYQLTGGDKRVAKRAAI